jgi:hypothetical protein
MKRPVIIMIMKFFAISLLLPIAIGLLGLLWDTVLGGINNYLNHNCSEFSKCIVNSALEFLTRPKTWKLFLLMWSVGLIMVISMLYQEFKPWIHEWFKKFR